MITICILRAARGSEHWRARGVRIYCKRFSSSRKFRYTNILHDSHGSISWRKAPEKVRFNALEILERAGAPNKMSAREEQRTSWTAEGKFWSSGTVTEQFVRINHRAVSSYRLIWIVSPVSFVRRREQRCTKIDCEPWFYYGSKWRGLLKRKDFRKKYHWKC